MINSFIQLKLLFVFISEKLKNDFLRICHSSVNVGIKYVVIPLVDNGSIESADQEDCLIKFLKANEPLFQSINLKIIFESDFAPVNLRRFIGRLNSHTFGINYDIGNSAALGFDPIEEFSLIGSRIYNVHVKDRLLGGTTVPLYSGNADLPLVFAQLAKLRYGGNFILQTARAIDNDHLGVISKYAEITHDLIRSSFK